MSDHDHHTEPPSEFELKVKALESLLVEKGLVDSAALDALIDTFVIRVGPKKGARVVVRAWTEPQFKAWLLKDPTGAIGSIGFTGRQGQHMKVIENTPADHTHVV